ncbi:hypothetical protein [Clostridium vincentii]|uniref:Methyl-accepting chemotaxis protein n=1 Tax=Clostridium vincentii TaxID=52704 RepID=A0A2T0BFM8_9CLOT|nr:hypothetical protein [Clostridium vincentii]PRR82668.1 hypothetical protein CLVI_16350 [Clostridium vincentii]
MKSIKTKITLTFSLICIFLVLFSSIVSYFIASTAIQNESKEKILFASQKYSEMINGVLDGQAKILNEIAFNIGNDQNFNETDTLSYLEKKLKVNSNVTDIYLGTNEKHMLDGAG